MAKAASAGATPLQRGLPDEIIFWEILVRLPPDSLLRCRPVCSAWHNVTSTREFLQAHHVRQPSLPIVRRFDQCICNYQNILAFDHRASAGPQLQPVARLGENLSLEASCDALLILSRVEMFSSRGFTICNPATREHAPLQKAWGSRLLGMYLHRPTSQYRLLLHRGSHMIVLGDLRHVGKFRCYVFELGSDQPLRQIKGAETVSAAQFKAPILVHDNLHWYQVQHQKENEFVLVFDTIAESFWQMRPPVVPSPTTKSHIFETEGTLGICVFNDAMKIVDTWVLHNYEGEVWEHKYRVDLAPLEEMCGPFVSWHGDCHVSVVSVDGDVLLLLRYNTWMFYVDMGGELVDSFRRDSQHLYPCELRLKQTRVVHRRNI